MLDYLKYLTDYFDFPIVIIVMTILILIVMNVVGELLEFKGKVVPEFMKIRKYLSRKKKERDTIVAMPDMLNEMKSVIANFNSHYNNDNITQRNDWMNSVNNKLENDNNIIQEIKNKIDENSDAIFELIVENKRETIINFAEKVSDDNFPVTREQFTRIDRVYQEYEKIIQERGMKNGEIDIAHRIIEDAYQTRLINHSFIEDVRWHGLEKQ